MADGFIQLPPDSTGKLIDASVLTVGANTVYRERDVVSDPTDPLGLAKVEAATPDPADYGLVVRPIDSAQAAIGAAAVGPNVEVLGGLDTATGLVAAATVTTGALNTNAAISAAFSAITTATWNSATALNTVLQGTTLSPFTGIGVVPTGTISGVITFEQSVDGTNFGPALVFDTVSGQLVNTYTIVSGDNRIFNFVNVADIIQIRLSTAIVGSGSIVVATLGFVIGPSSAVAVTNFPTTNPALETGGNLASIAANTGTNIAISTVAKMLDVLQQILIEQRTTRTILAICMSESGQSVPEDFDPAVHRAFDTDGNNGNWA